jgi:signal transduction histidine kinase
MPTVSDQRVQAEAITLFLMHWRSSLAAVTVLTLAAPLMVRNHAHPHVAAVWAALACCNYLGQAWVSWQLDRAPSLVDVLPRWMPWLVASVACSGLAWGAVPWLLHDDTGYAQFMASLFDLCLVFAVVSSAATPKMALAGVAPVALLVSLALLTHPAAWLHLAGAVLVLVFGVVCWYGVRVQSAIHESMRQSLLARELAKVLQQQQQKLMAVERERTLLLERQRLMRDMHDGLGSTLASSLAAAERGLIAPAEVAELLRDCVDDLRAVIDSLEPIEHDLVALLAMLRFRLGRRLDAAGMALDWRMGDLPPLDWLGASEALQVMRIVQEALANAVKHAQATRVRVEADVCDGAVQVDISDDGCGFDPAARHEGRGLRLLLQRAQLLGGHIAVTSQVGKGTRITLRLPQQR